ncbi:MAG: hypothetical protein VW169_01305 [Rhodospirillaceae bacterium]|jgi:hypothetical protein
MAEGAGKHLIGDGFDMSVWIGNSSVAKFEGLFKHPRTGGVEVCDV